MKKELRKTTVVAPVAPFEVPDEDTNASGQMADFDASAIQVLGGARSEQTKQVSEDVIRRTQSHSFASVAVDVRLMIHIQQQFVTRVLIHFPHVNGKETAHQ